MRKQRGFSLIELSLGLIIMGILATSLLSARRAEAQRDLDRAAGEHVKLLQIGLQRYLDDFRVQLLAGTAISGVANPIEPTTAELRAVKALGQSVGAVGPTGLSFSFRVSRLPAACVPAVSCVDLEGILWSTPLLDIGGVGQPARVGVSQIVAGIDAAIPNISNTTQMVGMDGTWAIANPAAGNPNSIIMARAGFGSSTNLDRFLPRDGSRPMVGTLDMNGNAIANATTVGAATINSSTINNAGAATTQTLTATTSVTTPTLNATNANVSGTTTTATLAVTGSAAITGALSAGSAAIAGNATVGGQLTATGDLISSSGVLQLNSSRTEGAACTGGGISRTSNDALLACSGGVWRRVTATFASEGEPCLVEGLGAIAVDNGASMSCRGGRFIKLGTLLPRLIASEVAVVAHGSAVNKPSCLPYGSPWVMPAPASIATPDGAFNVLVDDSGGSTWTVRIVDGGGGAAGASPQAIVLTGCRIT